jgi:hydroxyacylglutathione hydrolase
MNNSRLTVRQMELGPMMNYVYLLGCAETGEAAVVDPAWDVPAVMQTALDAGLNIRQVLLTHGHPDHMNGLEELLEATDAAVYVHRQEMEYMRLAAIHFGISVDFMGRRAANFHTTSDGSPVSIGRLEARCLHTPGHTPGSQCFLVEGCLFSGDTLFIDSCGRTDLPGSDPEKMWYSLNRTLKALPDDVILYPGHNYAERPTSTMREEKRHNPCMQYDSAERFLRAANTF